MLDAGVKRNHPSQENAASQRSLPHTIRILRRFFLFIFCDTNAGINGEDAKSRSLSEDNFHKKSFMQSCEMIFLQNFFKYLINFIYRLQTFTCDDANIFASSAPLFPVVRPWQGLTRSSAAGDGARAQKKRGRGASPLPRHADALSCGLVAADARQQMGHLFLLGTPDRPTIFLGLLVSRRILVMPRSTRIWAPVP